ncbi:plasmid maintenance system killer [Nesterenkonia sp. MY13]|uniref:Plasmid maintenance system killer n=1 Tax=Nesterenkonia sedimenti TaxID=1463632 RepID=A0A7X8TLJ7_9MICC|nr:type II toxin-antitoxin system RelE/ParE family toxin [Nesterenkonia sedimenti]NLS10769.1 plasmid maintenance system killer [Nesterenkonia sedimenti]
MIQSFRDKATEQVWETGKHKKFDPRILKVAVRKLGHLHHAARLEDLQVPPANQLEALHGDRQGQHSIRINKQWRICFEWTEAGPRNVEITDYH